MSNLQFPTPTILKEKNIRTKEVLLRITMILMHLKLKEYTLLKIHQQNISVVGRDTR